MAHCRGPICLINPFSGAKYSLPRLPCYGDKLEYKDEHLVLHVDDSESINLSYNKMQQVAVLKAILSADPKKCSNFILMIMPNEDPRLAIWRAGDKGWTNYIKEIACFKGQFLALLASHELATVEVNPEPKLIVHKTCLRDCTDWIKQYFINVNDTCLLLVLRNNVPDKNDDDHFLTSEFRLFELDLEELEAYEIEDIDGNSLFLGKNSGIIVPSSKFKGCRENSIYFSSDTGVAAPKEKYGYDDAGVWSISDETIEPLFQSGVYIPPTSCPIWLVPNP